MLSSTISRNRKSEQNHEIWEHLKQAIADCSGFKQWQSRQTKDHDFSPFEQQVRCYLRETLETLAY
ncbi:hypothetical protein [cyanobacterium endosymbiont of Epithemia turgida]|uniref:hypothetical protein n=1 Tax=cyanobacterium endosymbiont of Epithemia turgida TaxID=718217 RepID=UPI0004D12CC4|nr:hypothetical protein [cyanobacterium endosymbiont of Epithemia turgida]BAP17238.1 hypothetical protein ETSB_0376 [cyanobacterium endosymbiont of Epithemia turgida isolate EtSB Lake Yunoko]